MTDTERRTIATQYLRSMATVDLEADGEWSSGVANDRCMEYARLVHELLCTSIPIDIG